MTMVMSFGGGFAAHFGGTAKWNRIVRVLEHNVIVFVCLFVCLFVWFCSSFLFFSCVFPGLFMFLIIRITFNLKGISK